MGTGGFVGKVKNKVGIGNKTSLEERDILMRDCVKMENELNARTGNLKEEQIGLPVKDSLLDKKHENDEKFREIIGKEAEQKKDQAVWKAYSRRGGISDTLADIKRAVEHPAANAFEFDEEEGMYIIFITINNTYISRLTNLCREMCDEYEQIEKRKMEDSELQKEQEELLNIYDNLESINKELNSEYKGLSETYGKLCSKIDELYRSPSKNDLGTDGWRQKKEKLEGLESSLSSHEKKREYYKIAVNDYKKRLMLLAEECDRQCFYESKFDVEKGLYQELKELEGYFDENCRFYRLIVSPKVEELEEYMRKAHEFCEWISDMMDQYPL